MLAEKLSTNSPFFLMTPLSIISCVYLISLLNNILNFLDASAFYLWIVQGLIIIIAVAIH